MPVRSWALGGSRPTNTSTTIRPWATSGGSWEDPQPPAPIDSGGGLLQPVLDYGELMLMPFTEFGSGLKKGIWSSLTSGNLSTLGGAAEALEVLRGEAPEATRGRAVQDRVGEWASEHAEGPTPWGDVDGVGDFFGYVGGLMGSGLGSMAAPIAAGAAGAAVGSAAGPVGTTVGGVGGAFSVGTMLNIGETYRQLRDEGVDPKQAAQWAVPAGGVIGAIDTLGLSRLLGATVAKEVKQNAISAFVREGAKGYARGASEEGLTEMGQSAIREGLAATLTGDLDLLRRAGSLLEEGLAGGLAGGALGGAGRGARAAMSARRPTLGERRADAAPERPDLMTGTDLDPMVQDGAKAIERVLGDEESNGLLTADGLPAIGTEVVYRTADGEQKGLLTGLIPEEDGLPAQFVLEDADGIDRAIDLPLPEGSTLLPTEAAQREHERDDFAKQVGKLVPGADEQTVLRDLMDETGASTLTGVPEDSRKDFLSDLKDRVDEQQKAAEEQRKADEEARKAAEQAEQERQKAAEQEQADREKTALFDEDVSDIRDDFPGGGFAAADTSAREKMGLPTAAPVPVAKQSTYLSFVRRAQARARKAEAAAATGTGGSSPGGEGVSTGQRDDVVSAPATAASAVAPELSTSVPVAAAAIQGPEGRESTLRLESGADEPVRYRVVEADSLIPSHDPMTFGKDARYPAGVQERTYHSDRDAQKNVMDNARRLQPDRVINTDPTATGGPPQITPAGVVLGGNGRTMSIKRAYAEGGAAGYRSDVVSRAAEFGVDPAAVEGMQSPVLVRELTNAPADTEGMRRVGRDMNIDPQKGMSETALAVSAGSNLSEGSAQKFADAVDLAGGDVSLRDMMRDNPKMFRDMLLQDGIIAEKDRPKYFTPEGALNDTGKNFIENVMVGSFVRDADLMESMPASIVQKLERIVPPMTELNVRDDAWNITDDVIAATRLVTEAQGRGLTLDDMFSQQDMFTAREKPADSVMALAHMLSDMREVEIGNKFKAFAKEARLDSPGQATMFGAPDPRETFERVLGTVVRKDKATGDTITRLLDGTLIRDEKKGGQLVRKPGESKFTRTKLRGGKKPTAAPEPDPTPALAPEPAGESVPLDDDRIMPVRRAGGAQRFMFDGRQFDTREQAAEAARARDAEKQPAVFGDEPADTDSVLDDEDTAEIEARRERRKAAMKKSEAKKTVEDEPPKDPHKAERNRLRGELDAIETELDELRAEVDVAELGREREIAERIEELEADQIQRYEELAELPPEPRGVAASYDPADARESDVTPAPQTPAFRRWFAGSKVVDSDGKPKPVFHSGSFDPHTDSVPAMAGSLGMHFGTMGASQERARARREKYTDADADRRSQTTAVYLAIKNPIRFPDLMDWHPVETLHSVKARAGTSKDQEARLQDKLDGFNADRGNDTLKDEVYREIRKVLEENGYDGIVYRNDFEDAGHDSYIAFRPEQVKSATDNTGSYDPKNPSILASVEVRGKDKKWRAITTAEFSALQARVREAAERIVPEGVRVRQDPADAIMMGGRPAKGLYHGRGPLDPDGTIEIASRSADPEGTLRHETIHALRDMGVIQPKEWKALTRAALKGGWIKKHDIARNYPDPATHVEEAVAHEYEAWWRAGEDAAAKKPTGVVARVFDRIRQLLGAVREVLAGPSGEQVFRRIETGAVARRGQQVQGRGQQVQAASVSGGKAGQGYSDDRFHEGLNGLQRLPADPVEVPVAETPLTFPDDIPAKRFMWGAIREVREHPDVVQEDLLADIDDIVTHQDTVVPRDMVRIAKNIDFDRSLGKVVDWDDKLMVFDGNHRLAIAKLGGARTVKVTRWYIPPTPRNASGTGVRQRVKDAYQRLARGPDALVELRDLRAELSDVPRAAQDAELMRLFKARDAYFTLHEDQGSLTKSDRDAAFRLGNKAMHLVSLSPDPMLSVDADPVRKSDIISELSTALGDIPIRVGRLSEVGAVGEYKAKPEVVRTRRANDIPVAAEEIGRHINKLMFGGKDSRINWEPLAKYSGELTAGDQTVADGFAEFVRDFIVDPAAAKERAPKFWATFSRRLAKLPGAKRALLEAQASVRRYVEQPEASKVFSAIRQTAARKAGWSFDGFYTAAVDRLRPIEKVVESLSAQSGKKPDTADDAYQVARLAAGWMGKADQIIENGTFDFLTLEKNGKGLKEILQPLIDAGKRDDFTTYLVAHRALELDARGIDSGIDPKVAKAALKQVQSMAMHRAARDLYGFQDRMLQYRVQAGLLSQESYDRITAQNKRYVPFRRVMDDGSVKGGAGQSLVNLSSKVMRIKGSARDIVDPLESILADTMEAVNIADRNRVGQVLAAQADATEGGGKWVEKVPPKMAPTGVTVKAVDGALQDLGLDTSKLSDEEKSTVLSVFRPDLSPSPGENVVSVLKDGQRELYQVHPDVHRALTAQDAEAANIFIKFASKIARVKRAGATAVNPEFIGVNIVRDAVTGFIQSRNRFVPFLDTARGLFSAIKRDDLFQEWEKAGGAQAALVSMDRATIQKNIDDMFASPGKWAITHPIDALRIFGEMSEAATRLGEFRKARKRGKSAREAALDAREVTLDFSRMGTAIKGINSVVAFYNAGIQGTDKYIRSMRSDPVGTTLRSVAGVTVPSLIFYALNQGNEDYDEAPRWLKDMFWLVPTKGTPLEGETPFIRIPKPHLPGVLFGTAQERTLDWVMKKDPKALDGFYESLENATLPGQRIIPEAPLPLPIPDAATPFIEWFANRSIFRGRDIVPQGLQNLPAQEQYQPWTSEFAKQMSRMLGRAGIDAAPLQIENTMFSVTAGTGRILAKLSDPVLRSGDEPSRPAGGLAEVPIVRAFAVRPGGQSESEHRLYDRLGELDRKRNAIRYAQRHNRPMPDEMTAAETRERTRLNAARNRLSNLTTLTRRVESSDMDPEAKRERLLELAHRRTSIARAVMKALGG